MTAKAVIYAVTAIVCIGCAEAIAAQSDPYAAEQNQAAKQRYLQARAEYLDEVRTAYFAVGCKVFASEAGILPLIDALGNGMSSTDEPVIDTQLNVLREQAAHEGLAKAAQTHACDYWKNHPDQLLDIRREAEQAE